MENKVIIEGIITNQLVINKFGGTFMKLNNKRTYEYQGQTKEAQAFVNVSIGERIAKQVVERFKKGDIVRVEGSLKPKEVKDVTDENGYKIYEECIVARSVDALPPALEQTRINQVAPTMVRPTLTTIQAKTMPVREPVVNKDIFEEPLDLNNDYEEMPF